MEVYKKMNIAIIPMRSGSKEVKDKNIKMFNGKPLFYWTLLKMERLYKEGCFDKVVVSSDSCKYLRLVTDYFDFEGLEISQRPPELASDNSHTEDTMLYELSRLNITEGVVSIIEVTSPLILYSYLKDMVTFNIKPYNSAFLVTEDNSNFWRLRWDWEKLYNNRSMRQNNPNNIVKEIGAWSTTIEYFHFEKNRIVQVPRLISIPPIYGTSINTKYDFALAEMILQDHKKEILA